MNLLPLHSAARRWHLLALVPLLGLAGCTVQPVVYSPSPGVVTTPASNDADLYYFEDDLRPYGEWIVHAEFGRVWRPLGLSISWRPYTDGYWSWRDDDWYWNSSYPWGGITFHYGHWYDDSRYGWIWIKGREWRPNWVVWRYDDDWVGWSPAPPRGHSHNRHHDHYYFVRREDLTKREVHRHFVQRDEASRFYGRTREANRYPHDVYTRPLKGSNRDDHNHDSNRGGGGSRPQPGKPWPPGQHQGQSSGPIKGQRPDRGYNGNDRDWDRGHGDHQKGNGSPAVGRGSPNQGRGSPQSGNMVHGGRPVPEGPKPNGSGHSPAGNHKGPPSNSGPPSGSSGRPPQGLPSGDKSRPPPDQGSNPKPRDPPPLRTEEEKQQWAEEFLKSNKDQ